MMQVDHIGKYCVGDFTDINSKGLVAFDFADKTNMI